MVKKNILLVEDERITAEDIKCRLENLGYNVPASESSGEGAIKAAGEALPDLILMDIELKGSINGVEAAEIIRVKFNIPIIFVTAIKKEEKYIFKALPYCIYWAG